MKCRKCGGYVNPNTGMCLKCGAHMKYESSINEEEVKYDTKVISSIKTKQEQFDAFIEQKAKAVYEKKKEKSILLPIIFISAVILIVIIVALLVYNRNIE